MAIRIRLTILDTTTDQVLERQALVTDQSVMQALDTWRQTFPVNVVDQSGSDAPQPVLAPSVGKLLIYKLQEFIRSAAPQFMDEVRAKNEEIDRAQKELERIKRSVAIEEDKSDART